MERRMAELITVDTCVCAQRCAELLSLKLPTGVTVKEAVERSGLWVPETDSGENKLGVFAKLVKPDTVLRDRDRVEIYRPLIADPKEVRKQARCRGKIMKKGAGEQES